MGQVVQITTLPGVIIKDKKYRMMAMTAKVSVKQYKGYWISGVINHWHMKSYK